MEGWILSLSEENGKYKLGTTKTTNLKLVYDPNHNKSQKKIYIYKKI
jgi:hypothetical protein